MVTLICETSFNYLMYFDDGTSIAAFWASVRERSDTGLGSGQKIKQRALIRLRRRSSKSLTSYITIANAISALAITACFHALSIAIAMRSRE